MSQQQPLGQLLRRLPRFAPPPPPEGTLNFGRFKGRTFEDVWQNEKSYVLWVADHLGAPKAAKVTANQEAFLRHIETRAREEAAAAGVNLASDTEAPKGGQQPDEDEDWEVCPACGAPLAK